MRGALEHDDLLEEAPPSRDLVLGMPALLGIFFALALICAVCFGWGYSSAHGRARMAANASPPPGAPEPAHAGLAHPVPLGGSGEAAEGENEAPVDTTVAPGKPLPGGSMMAEPAATSDAAPGSGTESVPVPAPELRPSGKTAPTTSAREAQGFPPNYIPPAYVAPPETKPPVAPVLPVAPTRAGIQAEGKTLMVQIAAVSRAADAQTLANALRHDGFAAMVRTSTTDSYFHIQVGPFATLEAAKAMRTRLADTGYNAFIKP